MGLQASGFAIVIGDAGQFVSELVVAKPFTHQHPRYENSNFTDSIGKSYHGMMSSVPSLSGGTVNLRRNAERSVLSENQTHTDLSARLVEQQ